jgi:hypothetical protein
VQKHKHSEEKHRSHISHQQEGWSRVNGEKTKYMVMRHEQNPGQIHNIKMANKSLKYDEVQIFGNDT